MEYEIMTDAEHQEIIEILVERYGERITAQQYFETLDEFGFEIRDKNNNLVSLEQLAAGWEKRF
ncbi:hypothetical protein J7E81_19800 [Bacillus sp. ISL-18]|uniref:hypothetical protein n=1 Tax=Bacillus sp. ISL-18 TaxID=2819118 RepID=UPI001BE85CBB|nr:hypothetical protein [Bacillus sp. ISL-18]MBT2657446.1 hypothetical protein [Bacillus sp. ISL-18]